MFQQSQGSAREESETNVIVVVAVDCRTREELVRFKQIRWRSRCIAIPKTNVMNLPAPLDANVLDRTAVQQRAIDLFIQREDKLRVDALFDERFRQRT